MVSAGPRPTRPLAGTETRLAAAPRRVVQFSHCRQFELSTRPMSVAGPQGDNELVEMIQQMTYAFDERSKRPRRRLNNDCVVAFRTNRTMNCRPRSGGADRGDPIPPR